MGCDEGHEGKSCRAGDEGHEVKSSRCASDEGHEGKSGRTCDEGHEGKSSCCTSDEGHEGKSCRAGDEGHESRGCKGDDKVWLVRIIGESFRRFEKGCEVCDGVVGKRGDCGAEELWKVCNSWAHHA